MSQIRAAISREIKSRSQDYQDALALLNRDVVLDETQVVLNLGQYDAESEVSADASLSAKSSRQMQSFDWQLAIAIESGQRVQAVSPEWNS